jgi:hypothetical protein
MTTTHNHPEYTTHAETDLAFARIETLIAEMELRFERTVHTQTRQMFLLLVPVYGGIIVSLLIFLASKVL